MAMEFKIDFSAALRSGRNDKWCVEMTPPKRLKNEK
jgi:hypothetical protein